MTFLGLDDKTKQQLEHEIVLSRALSKDPSSVVKPMKYSIYSLNLQIMDLIKAMLYLIAITLVIALGLALITLLSFILLPILTKTLIITFHWKK